MLHTLLHTLLFVVAPCVDFFGMISNQTDNGCSRLKRLETNPDMCAYVGEMIKFTCKLAVKEKLTSLITSPRGTVVTTGLEIDAVVDIEHMDSGEYNCSFSTLSANELVNRTIRVEVFGK